MRRRRRRLAEISFAPYSAEDVISNLPPYAVVLSVAGEEHHVGVKDRISVQSAVDGVILRLRRCCGADRIDSGELRNIAALTLMQHVMYRVRESGMQYAIENNFDNGLLSLGYTGQRGRGVPLRN